MVIVILGWIYIFCMVTLIGMTVYKLIDFLFNTSIHRTLLNVFFVGLASLMFILTIISFFYKISWEIHFIINIFLMLYICTDYKKIKSEILFNLEKLNNTSKVFKLCFILLIFITLLGTVRTITTYDSGLYHLQGIRWLEEYGSVKGLANFNSRLGFNNLNFVLSAFFSFSFLGQFLSIINSLIYIVINTYFLSAVNNISLNKFTKFDVLKIFYLISFFILYFWDINSPDPDTLSSILFWLVILLTLEIIKNKDYSNINSNIIFICSVIFITISTKLNNIFLALIPLIIILNLNASKFARIKASITLICVNFFLYLPWIIRFIWLTGFLVYPVDAIDLFNVPWKANKNSVILESDLITSWARVSMLKKDEVLAMKINEWVPLWWEQKGLFNQILISIFLISIILIFTIIAFNFFKKLINNSESKSLSIVLTIVILSALLWILRAPSMSFSYNFIIPTVGLLVVYMYKFIRANKFLKSLYSKNLYLIFTILFIFLLIQSLFSVKVINKIKQIKDERTSLIVLLVKPREVKKIPMQTYYVQGQPIYYPENGNQTWHYKLPSAVGKSKSVRFTKPGDLGKGFYFEKP